MEKKTYPELIPSEHATPHHKQKKKKKKKAPNKKIMEFATP
jgi:hypothetical protein